MSVYADMLGVMAKVERTEFTSLCFRLLSGETLGGSEGAYVNDIIEEFNRTHLKLMVFGSPPVIQAVSAFYGDEIGPMEGEKKQSYISILHAMREDGFQKLYPDFDANVDNILISGPLNRRMKAANSNKPIEGKIF